MNNIFFEPRSPDPHFQRYSCASLPPYRFIPGINAHPVRDPRGHSFGRQHAALVYQAPEKFSENEEYLVGVDLYNQAYWWESHEAWENIWHTTDKSSDDGQFLQGLIQISAALIKWHLHQREGMVKLFGIGMGRLRHVGEHQKVFMGVDMHKHIVQIEKHFAQVLPEHATWLDACAQYPFLEINKKP